MNTTKIYYVTSVTIFGAFNTLTTDCIRKAINHKNKILRGGGFEKKPEEVHVLFECHNSYVKKGMEDFILSDKMVIDDNTVYKVSHYRGNSQTVEHKNNPKKRYFSYWRNR